MQPGQGLLRGEAAADVKLFFAGVARLRENPLLQIMLCKLCSSHRREVKDTSYNGACCGPNGTQVDAGNFHYAMVWRQVKCACDQVEQTYLDLIVLVLTEKWPSLRKDHESPAAVEFQGDMVEAMLAIWRSDALDDMQLEATHIRNFREDLEGASMAARRLTKHMPKTATVLQALEALDVASKAHAMVLPRRTSGELKFQTRLRLFSAELYRCWSSSC
jgi:hypothetical protein